MSENKLLSSTQSDVTAERRLLEEMSGLPSHAVEQEKERKHPSQLPPARMMLKSMSLQAISFIYLK